MKQKIKIVVEGGQVDVIYTDVLNSDVEIEVIDLDEPTFATQEELNVYNKLLDRVREMKKNMIAIY